MGGHFLYKFQDNFSKISTNYLSWLLNFFKINITSIIFLHLTYVICRKNLKNYLIFYFSIQFFLNNAVVSSVLLAQKIFFILFEEIASNSYRKDSFQHDKVFSASLWDFQNIIHLAPFFLNTISLNLEWFTCSFSDNVGYGIAYFGLH